MAQITGLRLGTSYNCTWK